MVTHSNYEQTLSSCKRVEFDTNCRIKGSEAFWDSHPIVYNDI